MTNSIRPSRTGLAARRSAATALAPVVGSAGVAGETSLPDPAVAAPSPSLVGAAAEKRALGALLDVIADVRLTGLAEALEGDIQRPKGGRLTVATLNDMSHLQRRHRPRAALLRAAASWARRMARRLELAAAHAEEVAAANDAAD
jgi:hypothetical protein